MRFATAQYSNDPAEIGNNFIHLTNYSVNKTSSEFVFNEEPGEYEGHKCVDVIVESALLNLTCTVPKGKYTSLIMSLKHSATSLSKTSPQKTVGDQLQFLN